MAMQDTGAPAPQQDQSLRFIDAVIRSGVDNPKINELAMNMLLQKFTQPDPQEAARKAIANRILESDNPDLATYAKLSQPGADLNTILTESGSPTATQLSTERDAEVAKLLGKGKYTEAKKLEKLGDPDYKKYKTGNYALK